MNAAAISEKTLPQTTVPGRTLPATPDRAKTHLAAKESPPRDPVVREGRVDGDEAAAGVAIAAARPRPAARVAPIPAVRLPAVRLPGARKPAAAPKAASPAGAASPNRRVAHHVVRVKAAGGLAAVDHVADARVVVAAAVRAQRSDRDRHRREGAKDREAAQQPNRASRATSRNDPDASGAGAAAADGDATAGKARAKQRARRAKPRPAKANPRSDRPRPSDAVNPSASVRRVSRPPHAAATRARGATRSTAKKKLPRSPKRSIPRSARIRPTRSRPRARATRSGSASRTCAIANGSRATSR